MLNELKDAANEIVRLLFVRTDPAQTWIASIVFAAAVVLVFKLTAGFLTGSKGRSLFVLVPGFVLMLAGAAAVRAFFSDSPFYQAAAAAAVLFIIVLPLTQAVQETSYISALVVWVLVLLTVVAVSYAESTVSAAIKNGAGKGSGMQKNRMQTEEFLRETGK